MSWEQLNATALACRKREARKLLQIMVAAQGDDKSWSSQQKQLLKQIGDGR